MKIVNTKGKVIHNPDYSKGRLLQSPDDPTVYIFTTWEEVPAGQGYGETDMSEGE